MAITLSAAELGELDEVSASFEHRSPGEVIAWAVERFGEDLVFACSFQDLVLLDLAVKAKPDLEIIFLDTDAHFSETWDYVEAAKARYGLNLTVTRPGDDAEKIPCGADGCCQVRKVGPLKRAVAEKKAWLTSVKRVDAPTRAGTPVVGFDEIFGLVKINPLATWTDDDVAAYEREHHLDQHPLVPQGYLSIGCAPTTRPVAPGEDPRAGRWSNSDKVECGLHQ
jgi:phosphoadenosine phosphosulfate reductase